jgi:hypothetical protein
METNHQGGIQLKETLPELFDGGMAENGSADPNNKVHNNKRDTWRPAQDPWQMAGNSLILGCVLPPR